MESKENNFEINQTNAGNHKSNILLRWQEPRVDNIWTSIKLIMWSFLLFLFLAISNIGRSTSATEEFLYLIIICASFGFSFLYTVSGYFAVSDQMSLGLKRSLLKVFIFLLGCFQIFFILATVVDYLGN